MRVQLSRVGSTEVSKSNTGDRGFPRLGEDATRMEAIAIRIEAFTIRLEAIATNVLASTSEEAMPSTFVVVSGSESILWGLVQLGHFQVLPTPPYPKETSQTNSNIWMISCSTGP